MIIIDANGVKYEPRRYLSYDDVLLLPQHSLANSRHDSRFDLKTPLTSNIEMALPFISSPMDTVTGAKMADTMMGYGGFGIIHRFHDSEETYLEEIKLVLQKRGIVGFAVGSDVSDLEIVDKVLKLPRVFEEHENRFVVAIDVANGFLQKSLDQIRRIRKNFGGKVSIISGSLCTPESVAQSIQAGANAVRIGVGNAGHCTTRMVTGCGAPQLTAIMQARHVINHSKTNVALIADGGIRTSGDVVKALAAGADSVMIGGLFAGADETPGNKYFRDGQYDFHHESLLSGPEPSSGWFKKYRGQASQDFLDSIGKANVAAEGESSYVPCKGPVVKALENLVNGLKSGMTYCGAFNLETLSKYAVFIEVSHAGYIEGTPHGKIG